MAGESVLDTSINNVGGVVHPAAMLLNTRSPRRPPRRARIYYQDQVNATLADLVMEPLDAERCAVGRALGLRTVLTFREWSRACFHHAGDSIRETVATNPSYAGFGAPRDLLAWASSTTRCRARSSRSSSSGASAASRRR